MSWPQLLISQIFFTQDCKGYIFFYNFAVLHGFHFFLDFKYPKASNKTGFEACFTHIYVYLSQTVLCCRAHLKYNNRVHIFQGRLIEHMEIDGASFIALLCIFSKVSMFLARRGFQFDANIFQM